MGKSLLQEAAEKNKRPKPKSSFTAKTVDPVKEVQDKPQTTRSEATEEKPARSSRPLKTTDEAIKALSEDLKQVAVQPRKMAYASKKQHPKKPEEKKSVAEILFTPAPVMNKKLLIILIIVLVIVNGIVFAPYETGLVIGYGIIFGVLVGIVWIIWTLISLIIRR